MLRAIQISDTHLLADPDAALRGVNVQRNLERVVAHINRNDTSIDLILATGDLVHDGSEAGYRRLAAALAPLMAPIYVLPGNHDDPATMRQLAAEGLFNWVETINVGNWRFVFLDCCVPGETGGRYGRMQSQALGKALSADAEHHTVIVTHHPPIDIGTPWLDEIGMANGAALITTTQHYPNVRAALFGHVHQDFEQYFEDLRLLGAPAAAFQFQAGTTHCAVDSNRSGYRVFQFADDGSINSQPIVFNVN